MNVSNRTLWAIYWLEQNESEIIPKIIVYELEKQTKIMTVYVMRQIQWIQISWIWVKVPQNEEVFGNILLEYDSTNCENIPLHFNERNVNGH